MCEYILFKSRKELAKQVADRGGAGRGNSDQIMRN